MYVLISFNIHVKFYWYCRVYPNLKSCILLKFIGKYDQVHFYISRRINLPAKSQLSRNKYLNSTARRPTDHQSALQWLSTSTNRIHQHQLVIQHLQCSLLQPKRIAVHLLVPPSIPRHYIKFNRLFRHNHHPHPTRHQPCRQFHVL